MSAQCEHGQLGRTCLLCEMRDENLALTAKLAESESKISAARLMADFAKGAIYDAIATEDGLDGEDGNAVMQIITEWQEHGTFDKTLCDTLTSMEKVASTAVDEDAYHEIQSLKKERDELRAEVARLEAWKSAMMHGACSGVMVDGENGLPTYAPECEKLRAEVARLKELREVLRVIKAIVSDKFLHKHEKLEVIESRCDISLCNEAIAKSGEHD